MNMHGSSTTLLSTVTDFVSIEQHIQWGFQQEFTYFMGLIPLIYILLESSFHSPKIPS